MTKTHPIAKPKTRRWYLEHHLPCDELVLLDGIPGVGKSLYLARITKWLTDNIPEVKPAVSVLLITSPRQEELLAEQQESQWPSTEHFQHLSFSDITTSATSLADYLAALATTLEVHKPQVMMLDSLEDILADFTQADGKAPTSKEFTCFWSELAQLAKSQHCTIIVTRQHGMHQSRSYGAFTKTGSAIARFILTMHYHPIDARKRVLTTIKNQFGLAGHQVHLTIIDNGQASMKLPHQHEHVRPSKSPATWLSDPSISSEDTEVIELVTSIIGDEPTPKEGLKDAVTTIYSNRAYHRVMSRMKLPSIRDPKTLTWYWLPSNTMRMDARLEKARTKDVGVPVAPLSPQGRGAGGEGKNLVLNPVTSTNTSASNTTRLNTEKPLTPNSSPREGEGNQTNARTATVGVSPQPDSILTRFFKRKQYHKNAS